MLTRGEIDKKYKWDLSVIYETDGAFDEDFALCEKKIAEFKKHEDKMLESAANLYSAFCDYLEIDEKIERLWTYASLNFSVDTSDNKYQGMNQRVRNLANKAGVATWFFFPYILRLDAKTVEAWYKEEPRLLSYKRLIDKNLRAKPHTLTDDGEKLLSRVEESAGGASQARMIFANSDLTFGKIKDSEGKSVQLSDTNYVMYLMSRDRRVRQSAFRTIYKTYGQFQNTFATLLGSHIKEQCVYSGVKNFKDSITASTVRDEVTPKIYNNLIKTVKGGLPVLYDYYALKKEVLGVDRLHLYDIYAPLVSGEVSRNFTYEEAVETVLDTVKIFGQEYHKTLTRGLTESGWADVYPTKGKRGGAFSAGCPGTEPYILLNFNGKLDDVSTLAHEAGHSMHTYFSTKYNEPHNSHYTIFVAEVASTVNELLMSHRLLRDAKSDEEKLYILGQLMDTYKGTLFRQTMFAEFERDIHKMCEEGKPLTADVLCKHYYKLNRKYFGKDVSVDKQISLEWARIPHFYTSFYVYKYATCISAASYIVKRIEEEGDAYVGQYIEFLKCGGAKSPLDSLKVAGVDMTSPEVVSGALSDFAAAIKSYREIYNKISKK